MQGIFQKENTDKALKYGIYRHLPTYEKIVRNLVSFYCKKYPSFMLYPNTIAILVNNAFKTVQQRVKDKEDICRRADARQRYLTQDFTL